MHTFKTTLGLLFLTALLACNSQPKVIEAEGSATDKPIFQDPGAASSGDAQMHNHPMPDNSAEEHKVTVAEVLNTEKYSYLRVQENGAETWIAISKRDVNVGGSYIYKGGLMKQNFFSKEFNRTFDKVLLVGDFRDANAAATSAAFPQPAATVEPPTSVKAAPGAVKIADLVANLKKYEGKTVAVTGKVVKLNPMIMGRNWIHLQDGSGKNLDLTVTTNEMVKLGDVVTLEGAFNLNRDFGAGYRYDYIVEGAKVK